MRCYIAGTMRSIMIIPILVMLLGPLSSGAESGLSLRNDREGMSYYNSIPVLKAITKVSNELGPERILSVYQGALGHLSAKRVCAYDLNDELKSELQVKDVSPIVHFLRHKNKIDDMALKILLHANKVQTGKVHFPGAMEWAFLPKNPEVVKNLLILIASFEKRFLKTSCFDEAYLALYGEMNKLLKNIRDGQINALFIEAYNKKLISDEVYLSLESARKNKLHQIKLTLAGYVTKINTLRTQYPLRDPSEKSTFINQEIPKQKISRRQKLLENYKDIQIIMMGNVVKRLRVRIESPKVEVLVYDHEALVETMALEPMERFRFAIKILRKEMSLLSLNTYFNGQAPDYLDILTAAYEIGVIPGEELDAVASLQEIWIPKTTFWEKGGMWVKAFASVASLGIPPPYGFIPTLLIVIIEATVFKKELPADDTSRLF